MRKDQFLDITKWQNETFGDSRPISRVLHLQDEVKELIIDINTNNVDRRFEFADCFFLLFGAAHADGMSYDDICNAIDEKFAINKARKWGVPDQNGVVNHIRE